jgi:hypothetical protein
MADALLEFSEKKFQSDTFLLPISQAEFDKDGIIRMTGKQIEITNKKSMEMVAQNG